MMANATPAVAGAEAAKVVTAFQSMRNGCRHYAGTPLDWDSAECTCKGNDHRGSVCAMVWCPRVRQQAGEIDRGW